MSKKRVAQLQLAIVRCNEQLAAGDRSEGVQNYLRRLLKTHEAELAKLLTPTESPR